MKVLIVISKFLPEYSGPSWRICNLYKNFIVNNFVKKKNILILTGGEEFNSNKSYMIKNLFVKRFDDTNLSQNRWNLYFYYKNFLRIRKEINAFRPDIIHVVGSNCLTASAVVYSKIKKIPLCIELVNSTSKPNQNFPILKYFWKPNLNINTKIIVISKYLKKKCLSMGYKNIWYRPNPINLKKFLKIKKIARKNKILLNIGQFIPRKNQKFLLEIMKFLPSCYKLFLCGPLVSKGLKKERDLKYFGEIKKIIKKHKLSKRVILIPKYVDVIKYFKKTDLYLMPSYDEGLGNTIIESFASGTPVMANFSEPSFQELIKNNKNGFLVRMNPKEWAKKIVQKINKINSNKIRNNSKNILSQANEQKIIRKYFKIFKKLINQ